MPRRIVIGLAVLLVTLGALPSASGIAEEGTPDRLLAGEWAAPTLAASGAAGAAPHQFRADFPANALLVHWRRDGAAEEAQVEWGVSQDGRAWTPWQVAPVDEDSDGPAVSDRRYTGAIMVAPSRHVRLRGVNAIGQPGVDLPDLRVAYLNTLAGPETDGFAALAKKKNTPTRTPTLAPTPAATAVPAAPAAPSPAGGPAIIPRAGWGADEGLRFAKGKETWPREYQTPEKVILHHTETPNDQDPMAAMRAVYYFHTVSKGWGDIGYNFLIDSAGRVYEGRAGGPHVIAGHALRYNNGSIGIAFLGSFQANSISPQAEEAAIGLIAARARSIDPIGQGFFIDKTLANIIGHRDCLNTACPGNAFYPRLPAIRDRVLQRLGARPTLDARITDVQFARTSLNTGDRLEVRVTVTNTGTAVLPGEARGPGVSYVEGQDYDARGLPKVSGRFRIGLGVAGSGAAYPYRWGLGKSLLPGESAVITGTVQMTTPQERRFSVALVQEYVKYWQQDVATTSVRVTGAPVTPVAPPPLPGPQPEPVEPDEPTGPLPSDRQPPPGAPDPTRTYFPATGHYAAHGFRYYWERNGGLGRFGYPLTEEFTERNPADGKEYSVQYFERARFEYHPEHKGTQYEVLLGLLGNQVTAGRLFSTSPVGSRPPEAGARYFPETKQWVSGPLLKYWTANGGLMTYGYPISPEMEEVNPDDGKTYAVQYFERNRLEYHPEHKGTPNEVLLGLLGRQLLVERGWIAR